ncbi:hypothetical protein C2S51_035086 [Perilla frutescens var. frutescens]|nr:hypothetical protein C2S51_035086 [Perilla frutescens var. frutescens]
MAGGSKKNCPTGLKEGKYKNAGDKQLVKKSGMTSNDVDLGCESPTKRRHDVNVAQDDNTHGRRVAKRSRKEYPNLKYQTSPLALHNSISQLTNAQKQAVRDMVFGSILNLDIKNVPPKLSYWVISNFDPKHSEIILGSDRRVHVCEDDVRLMFGFPRGQYKIERPALIKTFDVVKEWRLQFERPANRISASDVCTDMLEDIEGVDGGFGQEYCDRPCKEENVVGVVDGGMHHENEGNNNVNECVPLIVIGVEPNEGGARNVQVDEQVNPVNAGIVDDQTDKHTVVIGLLKQASMLVSRKEPVTHGESLSQPTPTLDDIEFWDNLEHIAAILEIEEAAMKRDKL